MADKDLTQGSQLQQADKVRYVEIAPGVYALSQAARIIGENGEVTQDPLSGLAVITWAHHEIHDGDTYLVSYKSPDASPIADNGTILFIITTHSQYAHMTFRASCGGDMEAELYEGTQVEPGTGAAMTPYNKSRANPKVATVGVRRDMTLGPVGTLLENEFVAGGTGPLAVGGASQMRAEWILATSHVYMYRITNRAGSAQPASLAIEWYERGTTG